MPKKRLDGVYEDGDVSIIANDPNQDTGQPKLSTITQKEFELHSTRAGYYSVIWEHIKSSPEIFFKLKFATAQKSRAFASNASTRAEHDSYEVHSHFDEVYIKKISSKS